MVRGIALVLCAVAAQAAVPVIFDGGVVNIGDYSRVLAPGGMIAIFGENLATGVVAASSLPLPESLGGTSVDILDGSSARKAPLYFVSTGQINAMLPYEVAAECVSVRVNTGGGQSAAEQVCRTARAPRLLTKTMDGAGEAILTDASGNLIGASHPAVSGEVAVLYLIGLGGVSPALASGQAAGNPLNLVTDPVVVKVDGRSARVDFKGLTPGLAGLYQINFEVPAAAEPGTARLTVEADSQVSQDGVGFTVGPNRETLASAAVPASGGTVSAGGLQLTVPGGAFASQAAITVARATTGIPAADERISDVFTLEGLPAAIAAPLTLSMPMTRSAGGRPVLVVRDAAGGEMWVQGRVEGGRVAATLPARTGGGAATSRLVAHAADPVDGGLVLAWFISVSSGAEAGDWAERTVGSVTVNYLNAKSSEGMVNALASFVNTMLSTAEIREFGLQWPQRVNFDLNENLGRRRKDCGGEVLYSAWDGSVHLRLDAHPEQEPTLSLEETVQVKALHLLMHSVLNPAKPGEAGRRWIWMDEAIATSVESMGLDDWPLPVLDNWHFAPHGLEYWASTMNEDQLRAHGSGAARFLTRLAEARGSWDFVGRIYALSKVDHSPVQALAAVGIDTSAEWLAALRFFCSANRVWNEHAWNAAGTNWRILVRRGTLAGSGEGSKSFAWSAPDLSEEVFPVLIYQKPPAGQGLMLQGAVTGGPDISALFYRIRGQAATLLADGLTLEPIDAAANLEAGDSIWVVVINKRAVYPFGTRTPVTVTVQLKSSVQEDALLTYIKARPYVWARLAGYSGRCPNTTGSGDYGCGVWAYNNTRVNTTTVLPIRWSADGRTFEVNGTWSGESAVSTWTAGIYMKATYDPATRAFINGEFRKTETSTSKTVAVSSSSTTSMKFGTLPFFAPNPVVERGYYEWDLSQPAAVLSAASDVVHSWSETRDGVTRAGNATLTWDPAYAWLHLEFSVSP